VHTVQNLLGNKKILKRQEIFNATHFPKICSIPWKTMVPGCISLISVYSSDTPAERAIVQIGRKFVITPARHPYFTVY
jgi:hypothetical protein